MLTENIDAYIEHSSEMFAMDLTLQVLTTLIAFFTLLIIVDLWRR